MKMKNWLHDEFKHCGVDYSKAEKAEGYDELHGKFRDYEREVSSQHIGAAAARLLRQLDQIAYVRFASVYREFQDLGDFVNEVKDVMHRAETESPGQQSLF